MDLEIWGSVHIVIGMLLGVREGMEEDGMELCIGDGHLMKTLKLLAISAANKKACRDVVSKRDQGLAAHCWREYCTLPPTQTQ